MTSILGGCLPPTSVKQEYFQLFSTLLGNQSGITIKVRDVQARHWVVVGCLCGMGVCGRQCQWRSIGQREGSWAAGVDQHHEVAALGQISTSGVGGADTHGSELQHRVAAVWQFSSRRSIH